MTVTCPRCQRVATIDVQGDQATYYGGCQHIEQIELVGDQVTVTVIYKK